ncbi:transcriptional regulator [bacterium M00.F.Ca.ET.228.01.1.1]|uniref:winged helix-turn-helix transcriptional regulator n=1 Tax=Paraburkholderia phenoliruptrix TaxID=252970 RepID=UPI0010925B09|nr:helix-turn-helix domain-containing protein [Paraburkholderia phenoliruptrix]TGP47565.1 transcriptional regulator [bacterium M00.F.Ca.ET.228.01.1.1]TGS05358.1 transcriptional regulator [bacterium M00.F.Ca.ET.191.01.1.1]TGU10294.1 transcriptional regulator [bacterium M00.F.Ca.ET.155.01.1.1]MBW0445650.1 helix-turn-helix transcriptional regulator [Paraburkholderia phenoliruptrix]MBW9096415.1 helix-turn-helix transcriptional regulator [Paraburkholderia phenoliruptrix]
MSADTLELPIDVTATRPILEQLANKWTVLILSVLCTQPARFNDLKGRLDGITHKALSDALKRLERNGLVDRRILPTQPIGVEYTITALGASLREPFAALYNWSLANGKKLTEAQIAYDDSRMH